MQEKYAKSYFLLIVYKIVDLSKEQSKRAVLAAEGALGAVLTMH